MPGTGPSEPLLLRDDFQGRFDCEEGRIVVEDGRPGNKMGMSVSEEGDAARRQLFGEAGV